MLHIESILSDVTVDANTARLYLATDPDDSRYEEVDLGLLSNLEKNIDLDDYIGWNIILTARYKDYSPYYVKETVGYVWDDQLILIEENEAAYV